jgi:hypothetical protein
LAWDETRRSLWCAGGHAGVMCTTAPGAPVTIGKKRAGQAAS